MTDTEKILEFDKIKEKLTELACTCLLYTSHQKQSSDKSITSVRNASFNYQILKGDFYYAVTTNN